MNQNIITYLNENKEQYPKDILITELKKAGYAEGDIGEGIAEIFGGTVVAPAPAKTSFWNFKDKKVYTSAGQKWEDFLFGVFAPIFTRLIMGIFSFFFGGSMFLFEKLVIFLWVIVLIYVFKRRRPMFYGIVLSLSIVPSIIILLFYLDGGFY